MDRETSKALAVEVSKAVDYYPNFGRDAEATKAIYRAFEEDLAAYPAERIAAAFREWRHENTTMPLSADILKILKWEPLPISSRPENMVLNNDPKSDWMEMTPKQKEALEALLAKTYATEERPKIIEDICKNDYSHWNRLSEAQKNTCLAEIPKSLERLRLSERV